MSKLPKRVWSGKKLVFSGKKAVREKDWQIGVYKPQFEEIDSWEVYDKKRENLDPEAPLDVYDSSKPEYIGTMEDWILATYTFYNYDRSVLKQDKCKDWETPIPPADPTRDSDWEYDYQFAWWDPVVGPIAKDTDYVASFNGTKRIYTVYVSVNDADYGSIDLTELTVEAWTEILDSSLDPTLSQNQLKVWSTVVTATANAWYEFDYWTNWSQVITWDQYPQAVFKVATPIVTITPLNFTSSENWSSVTFQNTWTSIELEYSYDNSTWNDVVYSDVISLDNGDKIYVRNKDNQSTTFGTSLSRYIKILCLWKISADGDISSLINPNGTDTLCEYCFYNLFKNSIGLIKAPALPFTTIPQEAYDGMFYWCTSLVEAPELPATTLGSDCYYEMFYNCSSLMNIPYLPALNVPSYAYNSMFRNCSSLYISDQQDQDYVNEFRIPQSGEWTQGSSGLNAMFAGCNLGGSFTWIPALNTTYYTKNTVGPIQPVGATPLTITAVEDSTQVNLNKYGSVDLFDFEISSDWNTWRDLIWQVPGQSEDIILNNGDVVYIRNKSTTDVILATSPNDRYSLWIGGWVNLSGDITTLINKNGTDTLCDYCFYSFFNYSDVITPPEMNVTTVWAHACEGMFSQCSKLTTTPALPATNLWVSCYQNMFFNCQSLTTVSDLPATTIPDSAYMQMYMNCKLLKMSNVWVIPSMWYNNTFRVPTTGTGTDWNMSLYRMFQGIASDSLATWNMDLNTDWGTNATIIPVNS